LTIALFLLRRTLPCRPPQGWAGRCRDRGLHREDRRAQNLRGDLGCL